MPVILSRPPLGCHSEWPAGHEESPVDVDPEILRRCGASGWQRRGGLLRM